MRDKQPRVNVRAQCFETWAPMKPIRNRVVLRALPNVSTNTGFGALFPKGLSRVWTDERVKIIVKLIIIKTLLTYSVKILPFFNIFGLRLFFPVHGKWIVFLM